MLFIEGYFSVPEILQLNFLKNHHGIITEEAIRRIVNEPRDYFINRFELKEGPPLQIRANWGHSIPVNVTVRIVNIIN